MSGNNNENKIENQQQLYADTQHHEREQAEFSLLAEEINKQASKGKIIVGIFRDKAFAGKEVPRGLEYRHFLETWGKNPNVFIVPLDANQIRSYSIIEKAHIDILVFPYGSVIPMDAYRFYSAQWLNRFMRKGGAVLTTGGIPFVKQANNNGDILPTDTPEKLIEIYDKWVSKFGVKFYPCAYAPDYEKFNADFLPSLKDQTNITPAEYGITVNNSSRSPVPAPPNGNVFPERYPVKQIIPLSWGTDKYGAVISTTGVLAQDYETGGIRLHFSHEGEQHPLSPHNANFAQTMSGIFDLLSNKIFAGELECEYACYRQGETVNIASQIINFEKPGADVKLRVSIKSGDETVFEDAKEAILSKGVNIYEWSYNPEIFKRDEYIVTLDVIKDGRVVSRSENGFAVWSDEIIGSSASISLSREYFAVNGKGRFITGTNYYESTRGEIMWFRPDVKNIMRDFRQMAECGVNMIRPHYHHLKWFHDYLKYHHGSLFPFFSELENIESTSGYMPDERAWRIFDLFIYLCHKHGIIYNGDLFTLVPSEMGDPRGWFGTAEAVIDYNCRPAQREFLEALEKRYKDMPLIAWDLFNEPYMVSDDDVRKWAEDLCSTIKAVNPDRLLCVGGPFSLGGELDFDCPHGKLREDYINKNSKPLLLQELHIDKPEPLEYEILQGEILRRIMVASLRSGTAGVCPWSWTRQMRLWQDSYEHHHTFPMEKWDDRLGLHTHDDGTLKIAGKIFRDIALMLKNINFVSYDAEKQICITDRGVLTGTLGDRYKNNSVYHHNNDKCFAAMDMGKIQIGGDVLISAEADNGSYMYFCTDDLSFYDAPVIYFKVEKAGEYMIHRRGIVGAELVANGKNGGNEKINLKKSGEFAVIEIDADMTDYWVKLKGNREFLR
jgi:hypothetical protein